MLSSSNTDSSDFNWRSSTKNGFSSEHLSSGARPVLSKQNLSKNINIEHFIPEYIQEKFHQPIEPKQCVIKAICKAEKKEPFYTFMLSWYKNESQMNSGSTSDATIRKSKKSAISVASTTQFEQQQKQERSMKNLETTVEISMCVPSPERIRRCDGPCGKMRSTKELYIHGQCDHAICRFCTINAPMIKNVDGSIGCCNPKCFAINLVAVCPDPALRHKYLQKIIHKNKINEVIGRNHEKQLQQSVKSSSMLSSASVSQISPTKKSNNMMRNLKELICVKLVIFEKGPLETIFRHQSINEIDSTESLYKALQCIVGHRHDLYNSRIFVNYEKNSGDSKLREIDLKQYGNKKLTSFPAVNGILNLVVDHTNLLNDNSILPQI